MVNEWISVEDRLPDQSGEYIRVYAVNKLRKHA